MKKMKNELLLSKLSCNSLSDLCTEILLFLVHLLVQLFVNHSLLLTFVPHTAKLVSLQAMGNSRPSFVHYRLILLSISHSPLLLLRYSTELLTYTWALQLCFIIYFIWKWVWFASRMRNSTNFSIIHRGSFQSSTRHCRNSGLLSVQGSWAIYEIHVEMFAQENNVACDLQN